MSDGGGAGRKSPRKKGRKEREMIYVKVNRRGEGGREGGARKKESKLQMLLSPR